MREVYPACCACILALAMAAASEAATTTLEASTSTAASTAASNGNATTDPPSPFLKHGTSYEGQTADNIMGSRLSTVAVGITVDNWSRWALVDPELEMECGKMVIKEEREDKGLPELVKPGYSEFVMFEKREQGWKGVCGAVTYLLEQEPKEDPQYLQIMFSVPYNFHLHNAYFAVGVASSYVNITGLFNSLYYYDDGSFEREEAGKMVQHAGSKIRVRGNMDPDTYKPILNVQILPVEKEDQFTPGEIYYPIRGGAAPRKAAAAVPLLLTLLLLSI